MGSTADLEIAAKLIAFTIFYYDYIITLPTEVTRVWLRKPLSRPALWFLINRYIPFFGNIAIAMVDFSGLAKSEEVPCIRACSTITSHSESNRRMPYVKQCFDHVARLAGHDYTVLLALRTYALYDCSRRITCFMICVAVVMTALGGWALANQHNTRAFDVHGCYEAVSSSAGVHLAILWEAQALFDFTIFVLTILKTLQTRRECMIENVREKGPQLTDVIFRDGALYFAAMVVCNVANILTFYLAEPILKGFLSTLATCISVTLMSRLMLNLYEASTHTDGIIVYELASVSHPAPGEVSISSPLTNLHAVHGLEEGRSGWYTEAVITECVVEMNDFRDMRGAAESSSSAV